MRFLIDANMPRSIVALVGSLGHEVEFARDVGLAAAPDHEIAARAQATGAALLTAIWTSPMCVDTRHRSIQGLSCCVCRMV
jgi:hypothetical protein